MELSRSSTRRRSLDVLHHLARSSDRFLLGSTGDGDGFGRIFEETFELDVGGGEEAKVRRRRRLSSEGKEKGRVWWTNLKTLSFMRGVVVFC